MSEFDAAALAKLRENAVRQDDNLAIALIDQLTAARAERDAACAAEREACAAVCDRTAANWLSQIEWGSLGVAKANIVVGASQCAEAIRARKHAALEQKDETR